MSFGTILAGMPHLGLCIEGLQLADKNCSMRHNLGEGRTLGEVMSGSRRAPLSGLMVGVLAILLATTSASTPARADDLINPPVLRSADGVLDILMVARINKLPFTPFSAYGWAYDICQRPTNGDLICPSSLPNLYGGIRLQLSQGDTLKIRLVNKLPPAYNAKHQYEPGMEYLGLNPTNLHTHGMLVSAHFPTTDDKTYGDNVFVLTLNPLNGRPGSGQHIHGDVRYTFTDYAIKIPDNHPSGLFWFHPHAHGVSLNQISAGMAGIITIGHLSDYVCRTGCGVPVGKIPVRYMILKDTQVGPPGLVADQQEPTFCDPSPARDDPPRLGACLQTGLTGTGTNRGRWYFSVNGQQYPNLPIDAPTGEIWRITNASASVTYNLSLHDTDHDRDLLMQVISIDGVSVSIKAGASADVLRQVAGPALQAETCPRESASSEKPLCVRRLKMFPSSRIELWVTYRDSQGNPAPPAAPVNAVFRDHGMSTGPAGDSWPKVDFASVVFRPAATSGTAMKALTVNGDGQALMNPVGLASDLAADRQAFAATPDCRPLARGHARRIFFNSLLTQTSAPLAGDSGKGREALLEAPFGMAYEEIDQNGKRVPGTFVDLAQFNPARPTICLTLGPGNTPTSERWELVNLAGEDHNFHMHQTKFALLTRDETEHSVTPRTLLGHGVLHDNVPLQHADGDCVTVADWRKGKCTAHPVWVEIPFTVAGDYVYHCHILEHEDGGMMARIRVRSAP
jgi:L-ascorbate oxidase